jgi:hypothetical protein
MAKLPAPPTATDENVRALLARYNCPVPFHEVRTRFLGNVATPAMSASPRPPSRVYCGSHRRAFRYASTWKVMVNSCSGTRARWASKASSLSGATVAIRLARRRTGSRARTRRARLWSGRRGRRLQSTLSDRTVRFFIPTPLDLGPREEPRPPQRQGEVDHPQLQNREPLARSLSACQQGMP